MEYYIYLAILGCSFYLKQQQQGLWWVELLGKGQKGKEEVLQRVDVAKQ